MPLDFGMYIMLFVRILLTVMAIVYVIFAGLMSRQIPQMTKSVIMSDSIVIVALGYLHLIFAVLVLLMTLFLL